MSVFGQQSQTQTEMGTELGKSDYSLGANYHGSAPLDSSITELTWLAAAGSKPPGGTNGVDCDLIHGDRWHEILGNMTQHVSETKTSTYDGTFTETYNSDVTRNMNGSDVTEHYQSTVERTYLTTAEDHHCDVHCETHLSPMFRLLAHVFTSLKLDYTCSQLEIGMKSFGMSITRFLDVGYASTGMDAKLLDIGIKNTEVTAKIDKHGIHLEKDEIAPLKGEIHDLKLGLSALGFQCRAAGIHTGVLLGPNQVL